MKSPAYTRVVALLLAVLILCGCSSTPAPTDEETPATTTVPVIPTTEMSTGEALTEASIPTTMPSHNHSHTIVDTVAPTCTAEGYAVYSCECGDTYKDDFTAKLEHTYEETVIAPTADAEGYTLYICTVCNYAVKDNYTEKEDLNELQRNSINMLNYLATVSERINVSKGNRLMLEEAHTILLNYIEPSKVDDETKTYLVNLYNIIGNLIDTSVKRERMDLLYNQDKASAIHDAVPDPLAILSVSNSLDWKSLARSVVYTIVDSYNNYSTQTDRLDRAYLVDSWELDDAETDLLRQRRIKYFEYMVDIAKTYNLGEGLTLNEKAVAKFADICENGDLASKVQFLESNQTTYENFANYWLELAECYYDLAALSNDTEKYEKCLSCIETYRGLSTGIFRKDYDYAKVLPKVIVAAQMTGQSVSILESFANDIENNTDSEDWSLRYFAAQVYVDLYSKTHQKAYLERAYRIALDNVNEVKKHQAPLNETYLKDVVLVPLDKPDFSKIKDKQKKEEAKSAYEAEKAKIDAYNDALTETRKTELPPLYEPLIVNCDLLFALADKLNISNEQKAWIESILKTTDGEPLFLSDAINDRYSFSTPANSFSIVYDVNSIEIPANLLAQGATVKVEVKKPLSAGGYSTTIFSDWTITKVVRNGKNVDTFTAYFSSSAIENVEWSVGTEVVVNIYNGINHEPIVFRFKVTECKSRFPFGMKIVFEEL